MFKNSAVKRFAAATLGTGMNLGVAAVIALGGSDSGVEGPNAVPSSSASAQVVEAGAGQLGVTAA